jgi:hypothetical protein
MYTCTCKNGKTWSGNNSACNDNASNCKQCCRGQYGGVGSRSQDINPADPRGFGFDTAFDGRIRAGIKTPEFINENKMKKEFNIFDKQLSSQDNGLTNSANSNAPNSIQQRYKVGDIIRIHPLDIAGARRTIGQTIYDPISQKWKIDDGRPRGVIWDGGKGIWGCWGKCKVKKWWKTIIKCNCNKSGDGCKCNGCLGSSEC